MNSALGKITNIGGSAQTSGDAAEVGSMTLAAFAADEETQAAFEGAARADWPGAVVKTGGLEAAAEYLQSVAPPGILVVDLGDRSQPFEDLMTFSEHCDPSTQVIAVGTLNDLSLYRKIVGAGVIDYLVKPLVHEDLVAALAKAAQSKPASAVANIAGETNAVMVIGARGGIGASTIAANGAWLMAETMGRKTVLLDLDVQFGTSALSLDILPSGGLLEALQHPSRVDSLFLSSALTPKTKNLSILAAEEDLGRDSEFDREGFDTMLTALSGSFEWVWIDVPKSVLGSIGDGIGNMKEILIVSDLSLAGMRDALRIKSYCKARASHVTISVMLNRVDPSRGEGLTVAQFERGVEVGVACQLPEDHKNAVVASSSGKPLAELLHKKKTMAGFKAYVHRLGGDEEEKPQKQKRKGLLKSARAE